MIHTLKRILCKCGCHSRYVGYKRVQHMLGLGEEQQCKWCGHRGLVDSQMNLFR